METGRPGTELGRDPLSESVHETNPAESVSWYAASTGDALNRLESLGYLVKRRRLSAGVSGHGYDGSLHSELLPIQLALDFVAADGL
jgi:hypothetical protein